MSQRAAKKAQQAALAPNSGAVEAAPGKKGKKTEKSAQQQKNHGVRTVLITVGALAVVLGCIYAYGTLSKAAMENRLDGVPAPPSVESWIANGASTNMQVQSSDELNAYERELVALGAVVATRGINTTVLQQGLTDIILFRDMNGGGQVIVLPGSAIPWPLDDITQMLPRPIDCTLVQVDRPDEVTAAYVFRACKEATARKYVSNLLTAEGWVVREDSGYSGASGPFMVTMTRGDAMLMVDYYAGGSGFSVILSVS